VAPVTILDRWILRRFLVTYLAFAFTVLLMFTVTDGFNHVDQFYSVAKGSGQPMGHLLLLSRLAVVIASHYAGIVPDIYYLLAPFVTLVAAMWVIFEVRKNNEFIPLQAAGIAPGRVMLPLFFAAFLLGGVMYADKELVIPAFADQHKEDTNLKRTTVLINPIPDQKNGVLSARHYAPHERLLVEARYTRLDATGAEAICAVASSASYTEGGWVFRDGFKIEHPSSYMPIGPGGVLVPTDVRPQDVESAAVDMLGYLTSKQLREQYERIPAFRHLEVELWRRTAYPCASLVLLLMGIPFVLRGDPGDKSAAALGLLVCIAFCALFFLATAFFEDMGSRPGGIPPILAAWLANLVFLAPGLISFTRSAR
jgi:lipopolysaccharide export system permease protein